MPIVRPSGAGDEALGNGEVRNGGTLIKGGGLTSESPMTKSLTEADLADDVGVPYHPGALKYYKEIGAIK